MEAVARLFLVRPPASRGIARGDSDREPADAAPDPEVEPVELSEMLELLERLARRKPAAIVASPSADSQCVARALARRCGLDVRLETRFASSVPGTAAESPAALVARVVEGLDQLAADFHGREVVVVTHADCQRAALAHALALEGSACFEPQAGQASALDWAHPLAREFTHSLIGMGVDWDVAAPAKQVHRFPGGASVLPRS